MPAHRPATDTPAAGAEAITVLAVGGTGESWEGDSRTRVSGMLEAVTEHLDERFRSRWVGYPASYGPATARRAMSYASSVEAGVARLGVVCDEIGGPLAFIGYSQGAVVVREFLHRAAASGRLPTDRIVAVGFVADPHQPPGAVPGCAGWGVAGAGAPLPADIPVRWVGTPADMICNCEPDSLIRDIADLTPALELARPGRWLTSMVQTLRANAFQNAARTSVSPAQWRRDVARLRAASTAIRHYLPALIVWHTLVINNPSGGRHTSYRSEPYRALVTDPDTTGCQSIAHWLQVCATFRQVYLLDSCESLR
ncbi:MAG: PE-PPE domain-containing protein [Gordonia sp. (in: high G+C Gram-positive bacteria)]